MNNEIVKETLKKYLKDNKYRNTPERYEVLDVILNEEGHFDADELYVNLKKINSKVSRATVYNTLEILLECGIVSRYRFGENHSRYEKNIGKPHHEHLVCLECGEIIEFTNNQILKIQNKVCEENKFQPTSATFQIFGYCQKCQIKN